MSNFHAQTIESVLKELKTSTSGLTTIEAQKRLEKYGPNKISEEKPKGSFSILASQFKSPLILILIVAGIISLFFKEYVNAGVIFGSVFLNTLIGFLQENKANNALAKLKKLVEHKALVLRDNLEVEISSTELVIGDVVILKAGNRVPADARLFETINLEIDEANLTGESVPSFKEIKKLSPGAALADRDNMVYASTIIVHGSGRGIVTASGNQTEIGQIAALVRTAEEEATPLQIRLGRLSKTIGQLIGLIGIAIVLIGLWQGRDFYEMFLTGIAVAVAAVPEGLTMAITVILVLGMQRMFKQNALVRKLLAAETLGSATVICTDKTGTLTEGKMNVAHVIIGDQEFKIEEIKAKSTEEEFKHLALALKIGALCNEAFVEPTKSELEHVSFVGAPTETALLAAAHQIGLEKAELLKREPRLNELPFDNETKLMATLHQQDNKYIIYEKGAPERILDRSSAYYSLGKIIKLTAPEKEKLIKKFEKLTEQGLRVLGVAFKELKNDEVDLGNGEFDWETNNREIVFVGFVALKDPLRPEARETIEICRAAGIRPIIITGDHPLTARAIAKEVGLDVAATNILTGEQLEKIDDKQLQEIVNKVEVFARVSPHHKMRIVKVLQEQGESVAMTGDGINDSPALKAANIGVALGTGTDIAKENADIVLLDNNFKTIVAAVLEGRIIFSNIKKVLTYLIADSFSEAMLIIGSMILGMPLAILPAQILWINIVNDGLPNFSLAFERESDGMMGRQNRSREASIIDQRMKALIFSGGVVRNFLVLAVFAFLILNNYPLDEIRTVVFVTFGVSSLFAIFSFRSFTKPFWKINPFSNRYLLFAFFVSFGLLIMAAYLPILQKILSTSSLSINAWLIILFIGAVNIAMIETVKYYYSHKNKKLMKSARA